MFDTAAGVPLGSRLDPLKGDKTIWAKPTKVDRPKLTEQAAAAPQLVLGPVLKVLLSLWSLLALLAILSFWQSPYLTALISPFRFYLTVLLLVTGLPLSATVRHPRRWVFVALPLAVGLTFLPYFRTDSPGSSQAPALTLALANVHSGNRDLNRLQTWVEQENPDILALLEITEAHRSQLEAFPYPYKLIHPRASNFGLALFSRTPPQRISILEEDSPFPSILAVWPEYRILVTHPLPPISARARDIGDQQIRRLSSTLVHESPSLIVLGDLNATGWDARLEPLLGAGLKEARRGHGILPTWPVGHPYMAIPLDHILLPPSWWAEVCRTGPDIGSDHYPLLVKAYGPARPDLPVETLP